MALPISTLAERKQQHAGQLFQRLKEQLHAAACLTRWQPAAAHAVEH
jgi:hypothetical protein